MRLVAAAALQPAVNDGEQRCGDKARDGELLQSIAGAVLNGKGLTGARFEAITKHGWRRAAAWAHKRIVDMRHTADVLEEWRGLQERRTFRYGNDHGPDDAFELGAQQLIFARVVCIKGGAADNGLAADVAHAYIAVRPAMQKLNEGRVNAGTSAADARVFVLAITAFSFARLRDSCRNMFRNSRVLAVLCCWHDGADLYQHSWT